MQIQRSNRKNGAAGNAMLYVLMAIVLFVALSFALTRGMRESSVSNEDATIYAQQITSYAEKMHHAVQSIMLQNDCLASQISFENATIVGYANAGSPGNNKCHVFNRKGGGANYDPPPANALDTAAAGASAHAAGGLVGQYFFTGKVCVDNIGTGPHATCAAANNEILLIVPWVNAEVCAAINRVLGNTTAMLEDGNGSFDNVKFTGAFANGFALGAVGFATYPVGCYRSTAAGSSPGVGYHFYYTLLAR